LQIVLNSGNHQHREREPVDWVYVIAGFLDLQAQTHQPEPARLLVALTKALQSSDPRLGPDNIKQGWRPNDNIDPRIMISPVWAPIFKSLPIEVHQALTASMLAAWMDKNLQYPITKHLPVGVPRRPYTQPSAYGDISGGKVWESASQFRDAGVAPELDRAGSLLGKDELTDVAGQIITLAKGGAADASQKIAALVHSKAG
jgi:hypothetical protein